MFVGFMLTSTASLSANAGSERDALNNATLAFYKQSGLEDQVSRSFDQYKDKLVPKPMQYYLANGAALTQAVVERKVTYTWSF